MNIFNMLMWLAEHWWIIAILAVLTCGGAVLAGFVSLATIIARVLQLVAATISFFATPANQIASKALYGLALFCIGAWLGHWTDARSKNAEFAAANEAAKVETVGVDQTIGKNAAALDQKDTAANNAADKTNNEARNAYVAILEKRLKDKCVVDAATLRKLRNVR